MFSILPVRFRKNSTTHQLFTKQHQTTKREESNDSERPPELTLFVGNVPPYYNEDALKRLFQSCGPVKSVFFADVETPSKITTETKGYKVAYVVFCSEKDLEKAVSWKQEEPLILTDEEFTIVTGLQKYYQEYNDNLLREENLEKEINDVLREFDKEVEKKEELKNNELDEEGWVTVSKKGRNPGFARKQSVKDNIIKKIKKKRRRKELLNFYSFQIRESKINHLNALQKKLEQDKKKIELLKARRMFKPF